MRMCGGAVWECLQEKADTVLFAGNTNTLTNYNTTLNVNDILAFQNIL